MKLSLEKYQLIFLNLSISIILLLGAFSTYSYFNSKNTLSVPGDLKTLVAEINSINKTLSSIKIDDNNKSISKETMEENIDKLTHIRNNLSTINTGNKSLSYNLDLALQNNILFYKQATLIAQNPKAKDLEASLSNLYNYKENAMKYYDLCNGLSKYNFPKDSIDQINRCYANFSNALKSKRDSDIKTLQNSEFKASMDSIIKRFNPLIADVNPLLEKCRNKEYSYEVLLNSLDKNLETFEDIRKEFNGLTVPYAAIDTYRFFSDSLKVYELYAKELRISINNEKLSSNTKVLDKEVLNNMYDGAFGRYEDLENSFQRFSVAYEDFSKELNH